MPRLAPALVLIAAFCGVASPPAFADQQAPSIVAAPASVQVQAASHAASQAVRPAPQHAAHQAAIASAHPLASRAGEEILEAGGNAFDAAVAISAALAVVEPSSSGLGGGGFYLLHRESDGFDTFIDAREKAPAAATRDMYLDAKGEPIKGASTLGPLAAAIPGEPAGFECLARHYGRLPLAVSLRPAIRLAREGFAVDARLQAGIRFKAEILRRSPEAAKVFLVHGEAPPLGAMIRQPQLAYTLETLAAQGAKGFYSGPVARELVRSVRAGGGIWTLADLAHYQVAERRPVVGEYRGARIVSAPPPSSGGVAILDALNILAGVELAKLPPVTRKHWIIEAMQRVYRDRAIYLGDPDFVPVPVMLLTDPAYAAGQRASIRSDKAMPSDFLPGVSDNAGGRDTTHFSVLDREGNRIAGTISINQWLGGGFVAGRTGVLLNNTMDDFSKKPGVPNGFGLIGADANAIAGDKRSLSSMSPTFVETPKGVMIIGSPGGSYIISMVLLGTLNYLDGMPAADIVKAPRYHHQYSPDQVDYETGAFSADELRDLGAMGHHLKAHERGWGNMQVVTWDYASGKVEAASDPRGVGVGLVY
ncbi:MAG: gamma-glutamyltransferase [Proteobacteria bacterium]|nr:gamma-glutamyltransferase [Pseudomonadota bacterium]